MKKLGKIKNLIKKINWSIDTYFKKNEHRWTTKINLILTCLKFILFISIYLCTLNFLNVISFDFHSWKFLKIMNIEYEDIYKDLVIAQIGSTFLTTAILSLVSSIEDKHILGEKATNLLFGKGLLKFYLPMFLLYIFMIINITLIIKKEHYSLIISIFLLSTLTLIYIITKIGTIFVTTKKYVSILYAKYYKECEKNIISNVLPRDYDSKLLINLKEETIKLVANNDNAYIKNINMYKVLIDRLLFNIPKKIQKYHLDMSYAPSIINDYIEIIEHFIYFKDLTRAMQCYNWLLSRFNFHNIYIPYDKMNQIYEALSNKLLDFNNEYETKHYLQGLSLIVTNIEIQQHFALTNDYSKINLHEDIKNYKYHYKSNYFEILYDKIYLNKYLTEKEKINCYTELFDIYRMSAHNGCRIFSDITNFSYGFELPKKRQMPPCIVGQATALLLIKTLLYKDERNFKLFLKINIEPQETRFAVHSVIMGLINIENCKNYENLYSRFYGLDIEYCKKTINDNLDLLFKYVDSWLTKETIEFLQEDYEYLYENCNKDSKKDPLFLDSTFKYDKKLINQYFKKISKKYNIKIKLKERENKDYNKMIDSYTK